MAIKVSTEAPTGLSVSRSGGVFKCSWSKVGNYDDGQNFQYTANGGPYTDVGIGKDASSVELTLGAIQTVTFRVRGKAKKYTKKKGKKTHTYQPQWSAWSSAGFTAQIPDAPTVNFSRDLTNSEISFSSSTSDSDAKILTGIQYQDISRSDSAEGEAAFAGSGVTFTLSTSDTLSHSGEPAGSVRWFRARSVGPAGASAWSEIHHAFGDPAAPYLQQASVSIEQGYARIRAYWAAFYPVNHPIDSIALQRAISAPTDEELSAPSSGWDDAIEVGCNGQWDSVSASISDSIGKDVCAWVRVVAKHDESSQPSGPIRVYTGALSAPTVSISSIESSEEGRVTLALTNASQVSVSKLAIFYRSNTDYNAIKSIASVAHGVTSWSGVITDLLKCSDYAFGVMAFVGPSPEQSSMRSDVTWTDTMVNAKPPASVTAVATSYDDSVRIGWDWSWKTATQATISWADRPDAWESTDDPSEYVVLNNNATSWVVTGLKSGKKWYFRVRLSQVGESQTIDSPWSKTAEFDLRTVPSKPVLILNKKFISGDGSVTASWSYESGDGSTQKSADIYEADKMVVYVDGPGQSTEIMGLSAGTHALKVRTTSASGIVSEWSDAVSIFVPEACSLKIASKAISFTRVRSGVRTDIYGKTGALVSQTLNDGMETQQYFQSFDYFPGGRLSVTKRDLEDGGYSIRSESIKDGPLFAKKLPIDVTVTGAGSTGKTSVSIVRSGYYQIKRPDGRIHGGDGFDGEVIATKSQTGEALISFGKEDLMGYMDDGATYVLTASIEDSYGQTQAGEVPAFTVQWDEKPEQPSGSVKGDPYQRIAVINSGSGNGTVDIYRLSLGLPELIIKDGTPGVDYVDPYPAFGDFGGHRIVMKNSSGDYVDKDRALTWEDMDDDLTPQGVVIDWEGKQVILPYNIDIDNDFKKDFERTVYLGGSIQGDWNPGVTHDISISCDWTRDDDVNRIELMNDLALYAGICHVRTPEGRSVSADVTVRSSVKNEKRTISYTLSVSVVDPEGLDGVTLDAWNEAHPIGEDL